VALASATHAFAEPLPKTIRVAVGTQGNFGKPRPSGLLGYGLEKGFFDAEFAKDGIKIEVVSFAGDGVQMNEALANRQVDFSGGGTLPNVIGLAGWNNAHIVFVQRTGAGQYLLTRTSIHDFAELKGKRIGVQFGNISHILTVALLAAHHINESDVTWVNLPTPEQKAALISGAVDAISGGVRDFPLREKGVVNIIGSTRELPSLAINVGGTLVSGSFEKAYPSVVARYVKVLTKLAWWVSQPQNREEYLRFTSQASGIPYKNLDADTPNPLKPRVSPLFDAQVVKGYADAAQFAVSHKLIRSHADVNAWFEPKYVDAALVGLGLQTYWTPNDGTGHKTISEIGNSWSDAAGPASVPAK
jgi:sulfonate transport system substrate-binding protein